MRRIPIAVVTLALACCSGPPAPRGDGVVHLAARFAAADGAAVPATRQVVRGSSRETVEQAPGTELRTPVTVPAGAAFRCDVAAAETQDALPAQVLLVSRGDEFPLWSGEIPANVGWVPIRVDLSEHAGRSGEIVLRVGDGNDHARAWWGSPMIAAAPGERRNLVLIEIDTLRADVLEPFGFPGGSSPVISALAREGVTFPECHSSSSWTRPAATSIMTSRSAPAHGLVGRGHRRLRGHLEVHLPRLRPPSHAAARAVRPRFRSGGAARRGGAAPGAGLPPGRDGTSLVG